MPNAVRLVRSNARLAQRYFSLDGLPLPYWLDTQAQGIAGSGVPIQIQNITVEGYPIYYPLGLSSVPAISGGGGYNSSFFAGTTAVIRSVYVTYKIVE